MGVVRRSKSVRVSSLRLRMHSSLGCKLDVLTTYARCEDKEALKN